MQRTIILKEKKNLKKSFRLPDKVASFSAIRVVKHKKSIILLPIEEFKKLLKNGV
jgi:hypothetical protein